MRGTAVACVHHWNLLRGVVQAWSGPFLHPYSLILVRYKGGIVYFIVYSSKAISGMYFGELFCGNNVKVARHVVYFALLPCVDV